MKLLANNMSKLAILLLPTFMRSTSVVELFRILSTPFSFVQDLFFANRIKNLYQLQHNGQVCYLRAALNDNFKYRDKDFEIIDAEDTGAWHFAVDEGQIYDQLMMDDSNPVILYSEDLMTKFADFKVLIPANLAGNDNMNMVKAIVNNYKLISKKAIYEYN